MSHNAIQLQLCKQAESNALAGFIIIIFLSHYKLECLWLWSCQGVILWCMLTSSWLSFLFFFPPLHPDEGSFLLGSAGDVGAQTPHLQSAKQRGGHQPRA